MVGTPQIQPRKRLPLTEPLIEQSHDALGIEARRIRGLRRFFVFASATRSSDSIAWGADLLERSSPPASHPIIRAQTSFSHSQWSSKGAGDIFGAGFLHFHGPEHRSLSKLYEYAITTIATQLATMANSTSHPGIRSSLAFLQPIAQLAWTRSGVNRSSSVDHY